MAERVGFEPTVEFPLHTLSRRAPSATRTPLHTFKSGSLVSLGGLLEISLPQCGKELPQHHRALFLEYSTTDFNSMVEAFILYDVSQRTTVPGLRIRSRKYYSFNTTIDQSPSAHCARLQGYEHGAPHKPPTSQPICRSSQSDQLSVGQGILIRLAQVVPLTDQLAIRQHNGTDRNFPFLGGHRRFLQGQSHPVLIRGHHRNTRPAGHKLPAANDVY